MPILAHSDVTSAEFATAWLAVLLGGLVAVATVVLILTWILRDRPLRRSTVLTVAVGWFIAAVLFAVSRLI